MADQHTLLTGCRRRLAVCNLTLLSASQRWGVMRPHGVLRPMHVHAHARFSRNPWGAVQCCNRGDFISSSSQCCRATRPQSPVPRSYYECWYTQPRKPVISRQKRSARHGQPGSAPSVLCPEDSAMYQPLKTTIQQPPSTSALLDHPNRMCIITEGLSPQHCPMQTHTPIWMHPAVHKGQAPP